MKDHSSSTLRWSAASGSVLARATVPSHSRSRIAHAARNPSLSSGRILARSGMRRFSSASTSGAMSTPFTTTFCNSPLISTSPSSTPRRRL